jgi:hypothetical protein
MVHLADLLAQALDQGAGEDEIVERVTPQLCVKLGLSMGKLSTCLPEIEQVVAGAHLLLEG